MEGSAKPRHHSAMNIVVGSLNGKGTAVAAENVGGRGFGVGSVVAVAVEVVAGGLAVDQAGRDLGVDGERGGGVVAPHVIYVRCLLYTSPSPRDGLLSRMPSSA